MQVDHLIPQYHVPLYAKHEDVHCHKNYMPSCRSCNNFKKTFSIDSFRREVEAQIKRLRSAKPTFRLAERFGLIECKQKPIVFYFEHFK